MTIETLERVVEMQPAFDRRSDNPSKNYGVHGVELRMVLKGKAGAVQFILYTNWQLPHVTEEQNRNPRTANHFLCHPMPADLGYHALVPQYKGQESRDDCPYLDGKPCYYDGSGLAAEPIYEILLRDGSDGVWKALETRYDELFPVREVDCQAEKRDEQPHRFGGIL